MLRLKKIQEKKKIIKEKAEKAKIARGIAGKWKHAIFCHSVIGSSLFICLQKQMKRLYLIHRKIRIFYLDRLTSVQL